MQVSLQVTYNDGTSKDLKAVATDLVAFESHFSLSIARLEQNLMLTHLLFMAWHVEKRTKQTDLEFESWIESVESITAVEEKK
jgi:hypothetical protein